VKILFVNNIRGFFGGVEQVVWNTARALRGRGHITQLAYAVDRRNPIEFDAPFVDVHRCSDFGGGRRLPKGQTFDDVLDRTRPDVVYFHKINNLPRMTPALSQVRKVRMVHDHDLYCPTGFKYYRFSGHVCTHKAGWRCYPDVAFVSRNRENRLGVSYCSIPQRIKEMQRNWDLDAILAVSTYIRDSLIQNGFDGEKIRVVHPILQLTIENPPPVPDENRVLFVGQLIRGKGVDLLLRALAKLTCQFNADIVGTGNAVGKLTALCSRLGLEDRVHFIDWVDHEKIGEFYARAKVVAAPSRWPEPFTLVGQEAMRYARPVVAFDVGGNSNWLNHEKTGLLIPEQDVVAYARALERVLTDTVLARRLGLTARSQVVEKYSFDSYVERTERVLAGFLD
jgi:glycosyltransferase involved in cell wall biosynthesis